MAYEKGEIKTLVQVFLTLIGYTLVSTPLEKIIDSFFISDVGRVVFGCIIFVAVMLLFKIKA